MRIPVVKSAVIKIRSKRVEHARYRARISAALNVWIRSSWRGRGGRM
jgi:hypothetical protein